MTDTVTGRGTQEDALTGWYNQAHDEAGRDYRQEVDAAWARYRTRLDGLAAEYQSIAARIRDET